MPIKRKHRTGPLKQVVRVIVRTGRLYEQNLVQLECGHKVRSNSPVGNRAPCGDCQKAGRT